MVELKVIQTTADYDKNKVKGKELFPELYANIAIVGRKKGGKTQLEYNILDRCIDYRTKVLFYCPTINRDATYIEIKKLLDKRKIQHRSFEHFIDPRTKVNELDVFLESFDNAMGHENEYEPDDNMMRELIEEQKKKIIKFSHDDKQDKVVVVKQATKRNRNGAGVETKKRRTPKDLVPDYCLVFDDLGEDLGHKSIVQLLIKNRHYRCKVIILTQWLKFLKPAARRNLDYILLFGGFSTEKLEDIHRELDLSDTTDEFVNIYKYATHKPFHFLNIDYSGNTYRENFDEEELEVAEQNEQG